MINNGKQYKSENSTRYNEDYVDYDPGMTASRNAYTDDNFQETGKQEYKDPTADFEQMLDESAENSVQHETDLFPTNTTMQFVGKDRNYIYEDLNEKEDRSIEEEDQTSYKINTKGKIMIAVYALVVLTIFTLIIMNTRLIKNMDNSIDESEARIVALQEENVQLGDKLEFVSSDEEIIRKAEEMGMVLRH